MAATTTYSTVRAADSTAAQLAALREHADTTAAQHRGERRAAAIAQRGAFQLVTTIAAGPATRRAAISAQIASIQAAA